MASGYMFSHYWPGDGVQNNAPPASVPGYTFPWFFHGGTLGAFGIMPALTPRAKKVIKGWLVRHIWRKFPTRLIATWMALRLIWSLKPWQYAEAAVRETAHDPNSRNLWTWGEVGRLAVSNQTQGENIYRSFYARAKVGPLVNKATVGPLVELAHMAFRARGR